MGGRPFPRGVYLPGDAARPQQSGSGAEGSKACPEGTRRVELCHLPWERSRPGCRPPSSLLTVVSCPRGSMVRACAMVIYIIGVASLHWAHRRGRQAA